MARFINAEDAAMTVSEKHGRWERCALEQYSSSGYAIFCTLCHKTHFVHYKYPVVCLYGHTEIFEEPKYCPSCGAAMGDKKDLY